MSDSTQERYLVGYALTAEKQLSFIKPSLIQHSRQRGIDLVKLDPTKSLLEQGKLDCIIHKLYNPKQVLVMDSRVLMSGALGNELKFPVIAKPLDAKSHEMVLIHDQEEMKKMLLSAPVVLQEFVNHGGVVFKVYVVADYVKCVKRRSSLMQNKEYGEDMSLEEVEMPPLSFLTDLAMAMRKSMGLSLFNFDVIRDARDANSYLVIDINYFPGYAKMPSYEPVLTDFFWDMVTKKYHYV